jgi:spore coat protein CotH
MSIELRDKIVTIKRNIGLVEESINLVKKLDVDEKTMKDILKDYNSELKFLKKELKEYMSLTKEKE